MRLAWGRDRVAARAQAEHGAVYPAEAADPPELSPVEVYRIERRDVAWLATGGQRVSDLLNGADDIPLHNVIAVDPATGEAAHGEAVEAAAAGPGTGTESLVRDEVIFLVPPPLPGDRPLRLHRRRILIGVRMGSYELTGQIHVRPGASAGDYLLRSTRQFVPLTDVELRHLEDAEDRRFLPVLIINTAHVTEMIDFERRARSSSAPPPVITALPVNAAAPRRASGPVLSRLRSAAEHSGHAEALRALQFLLEQGVIDPGEFQQKRATLLQQRV